MPKEPQEKLNSLKENFFSKYEDRIKTAFMLVFGVAGIFYIDSLFLYLLVMWAISILCLQEIKYIFNLEDMKFMYVSLTLIFLSGFFVQELHLVVLFVWILAKSLNVYFDNFEKANIRILLYPTLALSFFISILNEYGFGMLIFLILAVSVTDIGAFIVGKKFGKTQFSEKSPNKTIEGTLGGIAIGTIVSSLFIYMAYDSFVMVLIAFLVSVFSIFGDLFESDMKRKANIKDSGNILPGHGGVLDRLDGFMFSAPILFILLKILI